MFTIDQMQSVREAYTGSNSKLKHIEKEFELLMPLLTSKDGMNIDLLNSNPHTKKIEQGLEKAFDTTVRFRWDGAMLMNAYTVMTSVYIDKKIHIYINPSLVKVAGLTPEELVAITLHEVGHNYVNVFLDFMSTNYIALLSAVANPVFALPIVVGTLLVNVLAAPVGRAAMMARTKLLEYTYKYMKPIAKLYDWVRIIDFKANKVMSPLYPMFFASSILQAYKLKTLPLILVNATNPFRYVVEKESDRFAVEHGYGPAMMSGLNKMTDMRTAHPLVQNAKKSNPALDLLYDFADFNKGIIDAMTSTYPGNQNRIRTSIDILRKSAADPSLPSDLRKSAQNELARAEAWYNDYYINIEHNENKHRYFTMMNRITMEKMFDGKGDVREIVKALTSPLHRD